MKLYFKKFIIRVAFAALVLFPLSHAFADEVPAVDKSATEGRKALVDPDDVYIMDDMDVVEKIGKQAEPGVTELPRKVIQDIPKNSNDITDVLKVVPGVQFSDDYRNPSSTGEIAPAEVSISGGKTYENLFLIDGMSNSSILDPAENNPYKADDVPGSSQKYIIDPWIVGDILVYDSNISAAYDGFTGGVVDITTKQPGHKLSGSVSYKTTRSEWTNYFSDSEDAKLKEPRFRKNYYAASLSFPVTNSTGFLLSYSRNESTIPQRYFKGWKNQSRQSETYFLKGVHNIDGSSFLESTATYAPYEGKYFIKNALNSDFEIKGGGYSAALNYINQSGGGKFKLHADFSHYENSREAPDNFKAWMASNYKPWGYEADGTSVKPLSVEGGWGSINKEDNTFKLSFDNTHPSFDLAGSHTISYGVAYTNTSGRFQRKNNAYMYNEAVSNSGVICNGNDADCVEGDQYFAERKVSPAADIKGGVNAYSFYLEDDWSYKRLGLRLGGRATGDDYMNNTDYSLRTRLLIDIYGNGNTVFNAGYNRYYTSSLLANKLKEGIRPKYIEKRWTYRNIVQDWQPSDDIARVSYKFSNLKTPYSDEYAAGLSQKIFDTVLKAEYVERRNKNEFARHSTTGKDGVRYYSLNNNGSSEYRSVKLSWSKSWDKHWIMMNAIWQDSKSSNEKYSDHFDLEDMDKKVFYNGKLISLNQLPRKNYNRPVIINMAYSGRYFDHLVFSTFLKYRSPHKSMKMIDGERFVGYGELDPITGENKVISTTAYEDVSHKYAVTIDCSFKWDFEIFENQKLILFVEVNNILNAKNRAYSSSEFSVDKYETGRQFFAGASYEF